ncbi:phosphatase 2C-like domain-containing protein [Pisolithus marmoratus]|nr:phosphatase 2C-like domain-containing protein [Pisolithus marmoratus]
MSPPGPTMKTLQKRFCTTLPRASPSSPSLSRVRSNSAPSARPLYTANASSGPLAFFDSPPPPPPPSSRPGNPHPLSTSRLPIKTEGEGSSSQHTQSPPNSHGQTSNQPPFSLALTSPQANASPPHAPVAYQTAGLFPYSSFAPVPFYSVRVSDHSDSRKHVKRPRMRYHLDVGAYGIPKRASKHRRDDYGNNALFQGRGPQAEDLSLAVQVGEDAYFVRENAMGVADGVGGWSRPKVFSGTPEEPTPSALFARRLMHHCSAETLHAEKTVTSHRRTVSPSRSTSPRHTNCTALNDSWPWSADPDELNEELEDSLEDLEDGLDVLMILERAYENTLKAHVTTEPAETLAYLHSPRYLKTTISSSSQDPLRMRNVQHHNHQKHPHPSLPKTVPLMTGSSTALVAVLQHSQRNASQSVPPPKPMPLSAPAPTAACDAVLKIAHLGDCMGMLVRDEQIAWRSEEMWWRFNTPVQLGPRSSARPRDAQIVELPVQADDILILASDGLSDNLWDSEVLDEVVRFKRSFLKNGERSVGGLLGRRTLAGMLSEALCSRARRVSERRGNSVSGDDDGDVEDEVPFARRAREQGKSFKGGKIDDISVLVAVISPAPESIRSSL